ncbi:MAG: glycosyltransferase family 2 protein [Planctomycetes bacterium]|nr:glycosyltransferase family 2 protein [Planctomycetota bacterium]
MDAKATLLSIVCPAYQEEESLPFFHAELCKVLDGLAGDFDIEILYVDDGSRDRTLNVIRRIAASDHRVVFLSLSRNFGHQAALSAGLEHATGDVVVSMDADLQHPPAAVPLLLEKWRQGFDVVLSIREQDANLSRFKRWTSALFYLLLRTISNVEIRAAASDFRLLSRRALDALLRMGERHRFLRGMVQWLGFPAAEVRFHPDRRRAGESKYDLRRMATLACDGLFGFSLAPLRLALAVGSLAVLSGLGISAWIVVALVIGRGAPGWVFVLASVHLLGGSILGGLGILGEYVGRIFEQVKARPLYVLKEDSRETDRNESRIPHRGAA